MKIIVLDGWTLNPGDLSWGPLSECGDLTVYERTNREEVLSRAAGATVVMTNKTPLSGDVIQELSELEYIGVLATGCNVVDLEAATARGIPVCNAAGYSTASVAQLVFGYIHHFANQIALHNKLVHEGAWAAAKDFCFWQSPQVELRGKTLGIYGLGQIGKQVAQIGLAFGMRVIAYTRNPSRAAPEGVDWIDKEGLFRESDILSLHCPLTDETHHLVNEASLSLMKEEAVLINTGRGGLVDERALATALRNGLIRGAGLDVLDREPPRYPCPLLGVPNCVITPHMAWATQAARQRLMDITVQNLRSWQAGKAVNDVTHRG